MPPGSMGSSLLGVPIFSRKHTAMVLDDYHLAQIIKFTGEELGNDF
jgi:hypothetical protein